MLLRASGEGSLLKGAWKIVLTCLQSEWTGKRQLPSHSDKRRSEGETAKEIEEVQCIRRLLRNEEKKHNKREKL